MDLLDAAIADIALKCVTEPTGPEDTLDQKYTGNSKSEIWYFLLYR